MGLNGLLSPTAPQIHSVDSSSEPMQSLLVVHLLRKIRNPLSHILHSSVIQQVDLFIFQGLHEGGIRIRKGISRLHSQFPYDDELVWQLKGMKKTLKRLISSRQYEMLSKLKHKTLHNLAYRLNQLIFLLFEPFIRILPVGSAVTLKSSINIVKKLDYENRDIYLNIDSNSEYKVRLHSCKKEPETIKWIESVLNTGDVLYDVGANIGAYSLVASKFLYGRITEIIEFLDFYRLRIHSICGVNQIFRRDM